MTNFDLKIYKLMAREIELSEFEEWVYSDKELEAILALDEYLEIISLNYKIASSLCEAEKILKNYIDIGGYFEWDLIRLLKNILDRTEDAHKYIGKCYGYYCDGCSFLDDLGLGYGLSVTVPPKNYSAGSWDALSASEQKNLID
ncbi:MAG: hypothetical protein KUG73_06560, partial [Pseudomonadales bacterium]|nr:hypothetical protein [Pseudomonadales bacterium]